MGIEIEKKFLVADPTFLEKHEGTPYRQGYLCTDPERVSRVRLAGDKGFLTIKGKEKGSARAEFEYEIPGAEAAEMLDGLCLKPLIEKTRYLIEHGGHTWEVDVFFGDNEGLVVAEIELESEDERFDLPGWAGEEVTFDQRYKNANLIKAPYRNW